MSATAPEINRNVSIRPLFEGEAFSFQPVAIGEPDRWEADRLPDGFAINASTGEITATTAIAGVHSIVLRAVVEDDRAFVVDAGTDLVTSAGHPFQDGDKVVPSSSGTLPAPLVADNEYEVQTSLTNTFQLAARTGGPVVDFTDTGSGDHSLKWELKDEVIVLIPVMERGTVTNTDEPSIEIMVDWITREVTIPGAESALWETPNADTEEDGLRLPVLAVSAGDRFPIEISSIKEGLRQALNLQTLAFGGKEFDPEARLAITDGTYTELGSGRSTRWQTTADFTSTEWLSAVSNYENDKGTQFKALCAIRFGIAREAEAFSTSTSQPTAAVMDPDSTEDLSFDIEGLPQFDEATAFELVLSLSVSGRSAQNVEFIRTFNLLWNGSTHVLSDAAGDTTGQGTDEGTQHWRSTLTLSNLVADAEGVDFDATVAAGSFSALNTITINGNDFDYFYVGAGGLQSEPAASSFEFEFRNAGGSESATAYLSPGDTFSALEGLIQTAIDATSLGATVDEVYGDVANNQLIVSFSTVGTVAEAEGFDQASSGGIYSLVTDSGAEREATVTAIVRTDGADDVFSKSSKKFIIQVEAPINT
jgi:hypothetical protein